MLLSAGAATALAVVTRARGGVLLGIDRRLLLPIAVGWWLVATIDRAAAGAAGRRRVRRSRGCSRPRRRAPRCPSSTRARSSSTGCGRCSCSRCSPAGSRSSRRRSRASRRASRSSGRSRGGARTAAVAAIEERDGASFYVQRTSPLRPMSLLRTPGFKPHRDRRASTAPSPEMAAGGGRRPDRLARLDDGPARRRRGAGRDRCGAPARASTLARAAPPARGAHARADRPGVGARRARRRARGAARRAPPAAIVYSTHDRRAAVAAARARSASTRPRRATGRGATGSGSARSSAGACAAAPLLLPLSASARWLEAPPLPARARSARSCSRSPVEPSGPAARAGHRRDHLRARNPRKKGLDRVLAAWRARGRGRGDGEELARRRRAARRAERRRARCARGARRASAGRCASAEYRALLRRARVFVVRAAPRGLRDRAARGARRRLPARHARRRRGPTRRCRSRARSTRGWSARTSPALCARARRPSPGYAERALRALEPFRRSDRGPPGRRAPAAAPVLPRALQLRPRPRVGTSSRREPGAPRGGDAPAHVRQRLRAVGVGVDHDPHARPRGGARVDVARGRGGRGCALISSIVPVRAAAAKTASRSTA